MKVIVNINKVVKKISEILSTFGAVIVACTMIIITINVVGRAFFDKPFSGTAELIKNSIVVAVFFMIPWATVKKSHTRSTVVYDRMPGLGKDILDILACLVGIVIFFFILYAGIKALKYSIATSEWEEGAIKIPTWPAKTAIVCGSFLTIWENIMQILDVLSGRKYFDPVVPAEAEPVEVAS